MTEADLDELSLAELKKLSKDITRAIADFDKRRKRTALSAMEEKAKEFGFALGDLFSGVVGKFRGPPKGKGRSLSVAKYASPADSSVTWSGRGRQPGWFKDAIAAGKTSESMAL
ncbi:H-NS histone family protein [Tabrizicola sp.]|uniref:H-NS histone family protein n=1 Tax=Tabrizicola sp. TaxID=2005166 RepID=UPI00286A2CAA|nr:H-NS histone family protein [Tabrizicola sp.]